MKGEGDGEYLHLGVGRVSLGEGVGPRIGGGEWECGWLCVWHKERSHVPLGDQLK